MLVQNIIAPNVGPIGSTLDEMSSVVQSGPPVAFKVYTAWSPTAQGFSLEDPAIGLPTVQHAHDLGVKIFVAHKGLPLVNFDPAFNHPDDVVAVSRQFPDMNFVIYHSAWLPTHVEGPYDPTATVGIDSLLTALDRHQVPPNDNVWVDLATVWRQLITQPDQAAHALGKVLSRVGQERVMWGTDAIWYGSPQPQIMAMRAFQISAEYQDRYGYPALTDDLKAGVFGLKRGGTLRPRPQGDALRAGDGSPDHQYRRVRRASKDGAPSRRRGRPMGRPLVVRFWAGSPRPGRGGCRCSCHPPQCGEVSYADQGSNTKAGNLTYATRTSTITAALMATTIW